MSYEVTFYRSSVGDKKVEIIYQDENFWLTQKGIAQLFNVKVPAVSKHLNNIYSSNELEREATVSKMETVQRQNHFCTITIKIDFFLETLLYCSTI